MPMATATGPTTPGVTFTPWRDLLAPGEVEVQRTIGHAEHTATVLLGYQNAMVPGLLQTWDYARAVMTDVHAHHDLPMQAVKAATQARVDRQRILSEPGRTLHFVLTIGALWTSFGGPRVMDGQLLHLAKIARDGVPGGNVRLGVVPKAAPLRHALRPFTLFLHDHGDRQDDVRGEANEETVAGELTVTDPALLTEYRRVFDRAADLAVYGIDASELINEVRVEWDRRA